MSGLPSYDPTGLALWQRCPRRFWFERVCGAEPDHALTGFAAPLGVAGHAGVALVLERPHAPRDAVREHMLEAFALDLRRGQAAGRSWDPEGVDRALDRLEGEYLELVLRLGADERVRAIEWTEVESRVEWLDPQGRLFSARLNALGRVRSGIPAFGRRGDLLVGLSPGTWVVVDWRFGQRLDLTPTALALDLRLAFWLRGLERRGGPHPTRAFVGAVRDLAPRLVHRDEAGDVIPRTLEELNPDYVRALAAGRLVDAALLAEAEASRRRFRGVPKRLRRTNPAWAARAGEPRGALFHEADLAWSVVRPALGRAVLEIEAAAASGREDAYPARGAENGACAACPFRGQCLAGSGEGVSAVVTPPGRSQEAVGA